MIKSGTGSLRKDGHLFVAVHGLVLANDQAVPAGLRGTNPIPDFRAIVSCQSIGDGSTATVANVATGQFPASQEGDAIIRARVHLPRPCIAPVVFVASPGGAWFAASGG